GGARLDAVAPGRDRARLAARALCRSRSARCGGHAGGPRQRVRVWRALESARPLRRAHGLARALHRAAGAVAAVVPSYGLTIQWHESHSRWKSPFKMKLKIARHSALGLGSLR